MASTVKLALAVELLAQVEAGRGAYDALVPVASTDRKPGNGIIGAHFSHGGIALTPASLLRLMLVHSDNAVTDMLFRAVGGPEAVTARLKSLGFEKARVDRTILSLMSCCYGVDETGPDGLYDYAGWQARRRTVTPVARVAAAHRFLADSQDSATANAMVRLPAAIQLGRVLSTRYTSELLDIMETCATGATRMRSALPPGATISHKTGMSSRTVTAEVAIVKLPGTGDHVILAVYVVGSTSDESRQSRLIADLARAALDHWMVSQST